MFPLNIVADGFVDDGSYFGTSSTGAVDFARRRMLVSGLYAKGMLEVSW